MSEDAYRELNEVAGPVSRETFADLRAFEAEFRRWSSAINLAAPSTLSSLWRRHILDSAQLVGLAPDTRIWLDIGSGGGFPGAIVAILMKGKDGARVSLVESNQKKAAFLRTVLGRLNAPASVHPVRVDAAARQVGPVEVVTARALAPLRDLLEMTTPWTSRGARCMFHKGRDYRAEIAICADDWRFDLVEHRSMIDPESVVLEVSGIEAIVRPS